MAFSAASAHASWMERQADAFGIVLRQQQAVEIGIGQNGSLVIHADVYEETLLQKEYARFFAEQSIPYSSAFTDIRNIRAWTHSPDGRGGYRKEMVREFRTSDLATSGVFYDDYRQKTFFFPAVRTGAKTVLSYRKIYREPRLWGYFVFSGTLPVLHSEFSVSAPADVVLGYRVFGVEEEDLVFEKQNKGKLVTYRWVLREVDKVPGSVYPGILHHAPHLVVYVKSYTYKGENKPVLSGVKDLYAWYEQFLDTESGIDLPEMQKMVRTLVAGRDKEPEKVEALYNWVQRNIRYIAIEDGLGGFAPRSAGTVWSRRYGDCKDMTNLLHRMLEMAGIPSHHTWIGTRAIPYTHREVATPMADNHMILTYRFDGRYYFLDATDPYSRFGMPSEQIQGREALVRLGRDAFELVEVPVLDMEENRKCDTVEMYLDEGAIRGNGALYLRGYMRNAVTDVLQNKGGERVENHLSGLLAQGSNKFFLDSATYRNLGDSRADLVLEYSFRLLDYQTESGGEMFLNPHFSQFTNDIQGGFAENPYGHYFPFKSVRQRHTRFRIPERYQIVHLPGDVSWEEPDFGFRLSYRQEGRYVLIAEEFYINTLHIKPDRSAVWNELIRRLGEASKEMLVLVKT
jgi:transglutaminase-like putative cysteine protease